METGQLMEGFANQTKSRRGKGVLPLVDFRISTACTMMGVPILCRGGSLTRLAAMAGLLQAVRQQRARLVFSLLASSLKFTDGGQTTVALIASK